MKTFLSSLFTGTCLAVGFSLIPQNPAEAISLTFNGRSGNEYSYTLTLDTVAGESIAIGDVLRFTGLAGVTSATATNPPYGSQFVATDEVEFQATQNDSSGTYNISIFSTASEGTSNYTVTYQDPIFGPVGNSGTITGPTATPIPFEFSPGAGLLILGALGGLHWYKVSRH